MILRRSLFSNATSLFSSSRVCEPQSELITSRKAVTGRELQPRPILCADETRPELQGLRDEPAITGTQQRQDLQSMGNHMAIDQLRKLIIAKENPSSITHSVRTAVAAVLSLLVARLFRLPEAYWAAISTLIVMQSTLGAALPISAQRLAGTAMGGIAGGIAAAYFPGNALAFGIVVFLLGILCAGFHVERSAYRYASVAVAIIMLVPRVNKAW